RTKTRPEPLAAPSVRPSWTCSTAPPASRTSAAASGTARSNRRRSWPKTPSTPSITRSPSAADSVRPVSNVRGARPPGPAFFWGWGGEQRRGGEGELVADGAAGQSAGGLLGGGLVHGDLRGGELLCDTRRDLRSVGGRQRVVQLVGELPVEPGE